MNIGTLQHTTINCNTLQHTGESTYEGKCLSSWMSITAGARSFVNKKINDKKDPGGGRKK